jgi:hypothetical protein
MRLNINLDRYFISDPTLRRGRSSSSNLVIIQRRYNTELCEHFYTNRIITLWYKLPARIREINPPRNPSSKCLPFRKAVIEHYRNKLMYEFDTGNVCTWTMICRCTACRH